MFTVVIEGPSKTPLQFGPVHKTAHHALMWAGVNLPPQCAKETGPPWGVMTPSGKMIGRREAFLALN